MATIRTYVNSKGVAVTVNANRSYVSSSGTVVSEGLLTAPPIGGRIMSSLTNHGGLAAKGGLAGVGGGLAG